MQLDMVWSWYWLLVATWSCQGQQQLLLIKQPESQLFAVMLVRRGIRMQKESSGVLVTMPLYGAIQATGYAGAS